MLPTPTTFGSCTEMPVDVVNAASTVSSGPAGNVEAAERLSVDAALHGVARVRERHDGRQLTRRSSLARRTAANSRAWTSRAPIAVEATSAPMTTHDEGVRPRGGAASLLSFLRAAFLVMTQGSSVSVR